MIVSYPLNPVCVCAPDEFYERTDRLCRKASTLSSFMTMRIRILFSRGNREDHFLSFEGAKEVGVEFYSLSKSYNLTGARISFRCGKQGNYPRNSACSAPRLTTGSLYPVQYAAIAAIDGTG